MSLHFIYRLTTYILAVHVILQAIEVLIIQRTMLKQDLYNVSNYSDQFKKCPQFLAQLFTTIITPHFFSVILLTHIFLAVALIFKLHFLILLPLLLTHLVINLRFLGSYNGGSDHVTTMVLTALVASSFYLDNPYSLKMGLYYIAIQSTLSYFIAGYVKIKQKSWLSGNALRIFLLLEANNATRFFKKLAPMKPFILLMTWGMFFFEILFPLTILNINILMIFLIIGFAFHFMNFIIFGLNRFVISWTMTYPAILYLSYNIQI
ncbi:MAG: hypothetical protein HOO06_13390 [Bdellovibrionaceae bacterium]|jgi:hypothetical protein|nr:hypothetical protein [Pseudobdellovibrionaceae bacterium]